MRYFLHHKQSDTLPFRCQYLYKIFNLWFVKTGTIECFDVLESFPFENNRDILLVYGHNYEITHLFFRQPQLIPEKNIFIISCNASYSLKNRNIFLAPQKDDRLPLLCGDEFNFGFDVSEVELKLYNSREVNFMKKLTSLFDKISS